DPTRLSREQAPNPDQFLSRRQLELLLSRWGPFQKSSASKQPSRMGMKVRVVV
ncbi:hypothetical protein Tco_0783148, partial [Tanacetum coccineum]